MLGLILHMALEACDGHTNNIVYFVESVTENDALMSKAIVKPNTQNVPGGKCQLKLT